MFANTRIDLLNTLTAHGNPKMYVESGSTVGGCHEQTVYRPISRKKALDLMDSGEWYARHHSIGKEILINRYG